MLFAPHPPSAVPPFNLASPSSSPSFQPSSSSASSSLSQRPIAAMPAVIVDRPAAPPTRLHVDVLVLDYLLWFCVDSLLKERRLRLDGQVGKREWVDASSSADMGLRLVNSFYQTFLHLHPDTPLSADIGLRLHICRFTTLFLRRFDTTSPSFTQTVSENLQERTKTWLSRRQVPNVLTTSSPPSSSSSSSSITLGLGGQEFGPGATPFPSFNLQRNQDSLLLQIGYAAPPPQTRPQQQLWGNASLKDGLKELMILTTWTSANFAEVSGLWMDTAVAYMLQATLEAYRCHGAQDLGALNECFSWGLNERGDDPLAEEVEEVVVNEMFAGDDGEVGVEFERIKNKALAEIIPSAGTPLETHFETLATSHHPWHTFEDKVVGYLKAIINSQPRPVLLQLEQGKLEGYDDLDVQAVLSGVGVEGVSVGVGGE